MSAVRMVAASTFRRRWRGIVAVALVVGVIGAIVLATVAGARRTSTSLERFNAESRASDVEIVVPDATPEALRQFAGDPQVRAVGRTYAFAAFVQGPANLILGAPADDSFGRTVDRAQVLRGRNANASAVDEVTVSEALAQQLHQDVGGHLDATSLTPEQAELARKTGDPGVPAGPPLRFRIVGITRRPLDLGVRGATGGIVAPTRAFTRAYTGRIGNWATVLRVRARDGARGVDGVVAAARRTFRDQELDVQTLAVETEGARNAIDVATTALWILAGIVAAGGLVTVAIVLGRELDIATVENETLLALGLSRVQRIVTSGLQALAIAGGGALVASAVAMLVSPLFPIGVARRAEPHPGFRPDAAVLVLGVVGVVAAVLAIAVVGAVRGTRRVSARAGAGERRRASVVVDRAARTGLGPCTTNGLRMALEPGRGNTAVPVRSAFAAAALGVLGVTTALVFGAALHHLTATPRLYGWTWDAAAQVGPSADPLRGIKGIDAVASANYTNVEIDGRPTIGWGFTPAPRRIEPEIVAGRAPRTAHEVALGSRTLHQLGKHFGDTVHAVGTDGTNTFRIVGRVALPTLVDAQPLAESALFSMRGYLSIVNDDQQNQTKFTLVRFAPAADRSAITRELAKLSAEAGPLPRRTLPPEIGRLRDVGWLPVSLAVTLGGLGVIGVAHALVTAVRRRRKELALLKTLGFVRRQVRATIAWQATTLAAVGIVVGVPLGLVLGRVIWRAVADGLGVVPVFATPALGIFAIVAAVLVVTNALAILPGRAAARRPIAAELRDE